MHSSKSLQNDLNNRLQICYVSQKFDGHNLIDTNCSISEICFDSCVLGSNTADYFYTFMLILIRLPYGLLPKNTFFQRFNRDKT